jgi:hypothetical protein
MDAPMVARVVEALGPDDIPETDLATTLGRINTVLRDHHQSRSFGTIVRLGTAWKKPVPTVILGFPDPEGVEIGDDWLLDVVVTDELFEKCVAAPSTWTNAPCVEQEAVRFARMSIGVTAHPVEAGSFGGYVKTASGDTFGVTAAHVTPGSIGSEICHPSAVELTARLQSILPYTNYHPQPIKYRSQREEEIREMLAKYQLSNDHVEGIEILGIPGKTIISGLRLGQLVAKEYDYKEGIFAAHNRYLCQAGLTPFVLPTGYEDLTKTKMDWALFTVENSKLVEICPFPRFPCLC